MDWINNWTRTSYRLVTHTEVLTICRNTYVVYIHKLTIPWLSKSQELRLQLLTGLEKGARVGVLRTDWLRATEWLNGENLKMLTSDV